jgi:oligopeptide transport system substrate-binding protein
MLSGLPTVNTLNLTGVFMKRIFMSIICLVLAVCVSCSKAKDPDMVYMNDEAEMKTMDPQLLTDHSAIEVAGSVWEGLTRTGKDGTVIPGVAEKWTVQGTKWTFILRKNAKWSNGEPVTADDFYFAIKRACDPLTAAEYSYMMYHIKNAEEFNKKKITDFSKVGVKVLDPYTLQIELARPTPFFASILAFPTYFPVSEKHYNLNKKNFSLKPETMLYNGPWKIAKWIKSDRIIVEKNEQYWNKESIKISKIAYLFIRDSNTTINMYKNNQLDLTAVAGNKLEQFKDSPELKGFDQGTIAYFEYNVNNKFFANKKIRKAFAFAVNRDEYVSKVLKGGSMPAYAFVPGLIRGKNKSFRQEYGEKLFSYSTVEAKKLLAEGLKEIGHTGVVTVKLMTDDGDRALQSAQYIQENLRAALGVNIVIETVTFGMRLTNMQNKNFDFCFALWGPDYMDAMTYMDLWITNGGNNHTGWGNAVYDAEIRKAQNSGDNNVRMDAMARAEKILIEEMAIAPMYVRYRNYVTKPHLKGVVKRAFGQETDFYWAYIER